MFNVAPLALHCYCCWAPMLLLAVCEPIIQQMIMLSIKLVQVFEIFFSVIFVVMRACHRRNLKAQTKANEQVCELVFHQQLKEDSSMAMARSSYNVLVLVPGTSTS